MASAGPFIVIWMVASELSTPTTAAMTQAAHDALGPATEVRAEAAPDSEGMRLADVGDAAGAVRISWDVQEHRRARLICYTPRGQRWVDREVTFAADDPEGERGRTLGFLLASVFLDAGAVPRAAERAEAKAEPAPPVEHPAAVKASDEVINDSSGSVVKKKSAADSPPSMSVGAAAQAVAPGAATAFGAWLGVEHSVVARTLWIGGSGQARLGSIPEAQATSRFLAVGAHATWVMWSPFEVSRLGLRGSASLAQISVARSAPGQSAPERQSRFLPAFELVLRGGYDFAASSGLILDLGAEFLAGNTDIVVDGETLAEWSPVIGVARVGVQTSF